MAHPLWGLTAASLLLALGGDAKGGDKQVRVIKTPRGGIQPQALVDDKGNVHLLFFKGDPKAGDLFYSRRDAGKTEFSRPLKVNSQAGSAIAVGTIRGGQLALGKNGRVHVAWNGSGQALPKNPAKGTPMLYARLNDDGAAFEEQRNLMRLSDVLDGGGTVAADRQGNVHVAWHARKIGSDSGEENRQVWAALSRDDGKTFAKEIAINTKPTGACGCCGMKGFADRKGNAYFIYRTAHKGTQRDMFLLTSTDKGKGFDGTLVHKWEVQACPMSSESFAEGPEGVYVAWDTDGQVYFARIKPGTAAIGKPVAAPGAGKSRKHPAVAVNAKGEILLAWTEDTGWQRGGDLAWQVFDKSGQPTKEQGRMRGAIPVWGLPTAIAEHGGGFTIWH